MALFVSLGVSNYKGKRKEDVSIHKAFLWVQVESVLDFNGKTLQDSVVLLRCMRRAAGRETV
jgi:hypothetical protein